MTFADETPSALHSTVLDSQYSGEVVRLINLKRSGAGLFLLMVGPILTGVAQAHSEYMRDHSCFAHQCPGEPSPERRACLAGFRSYGTQISDDGEITSMARTPPSGNQSCYVKFRDPAGYEVLSGDIIFAK